jgi:hypothetical protein
MRLNFGTVRGRVPSTESSRNTPPPSSPAKYVLMCYSQESETPSAFNQWFHLKPTGQVYKMLVRGQEAQFWTVNFLLISFYLFRYCNAFSFLTDTTQFTTFVFITLTFASLCNKLRFGQSSKHCLECSPICIPVTFRGPQILHRSRNRLKIPIAERVTVGKFHVQYPQLLRASNFNPGFLYLCYNSFFPTTTGHEGPMGKQRYSSSLSLTSAVDWCWESTQGSCRCTPEKSNRHPLYRSLDGSQGLSEQVPNVSLTPRIVPRTIKPRNVSLYHFSYYGLRYHSFSLFFLSGARAQCGSGAPHSWGF